MLKYPALYSVSVHYRNIALAKGSCFQPGSRFVCSFHLRKKGSKRKMLCQYFQTISKQIRFRRLFKPTESFIFRESFSLCKQTKNLSNSVDRIEFTFTVCLLLDLCQCLQYETINIECSEHNIFYTTGDCIELVEREIYLNVNIKEKQPYFIKWQ